MLLDNKKIIIQIEGRFLIDSKVVKSLQEYKKRGFRMALLDFDFSKHYIDNISMFDILKIDFCLDKDNDIKTKIELAHRLGLKVAAYNVNTKESKQKALEFGCDYYQGNSIADIVRSDVHKMEHLQSNFFRLAAAISKETPEFDEISDIISLDITLTFSLIKIVNSAYFALPNRVKDIKQALTILGLKQLRQWIYLLTFSTDGGMTDELIKVSFMRAAFCEIMCKKVKNIPITSNEAYILGMFSILDVLLEVPMESAVSELPINDEIKDALVGKEGMCLDLISLCIAYEEGKWILVEKLSNNWE